MAWNDKLGRHGAFDYRIADAELDGITVSISIEGTRNCDVEEMKHQLFLHSNVMKIIEPGGANASWVVKFEFNNITFDVNALKRYVKNCLKMTTRHPVFHRVYGGHIEYYPDGSVYIYDELSQQVCMWIADEYEDEDAFAAAINACVIARKAGVTALKSILRSNK